MVSTIESLSLDLQCLAEADSVPDLFRRLEACEQALRLDPAVEPTMFRGAIVSRVELEGLQQIERVVRQGRVRRIDTDRIVLDDGEIPTDRGTVHVDCTAYGLRATPPRPMFEDDRITPQSLMGGFTTYNAAVIGYVEAVRDDDADKNRLCPPTPYPSLSSDWINVFAGGFRSTTQMLQEPDLAALAGDVQAQHHTRPQRPHGRPADAGGAWSLVRAPGAGARQRRPVAGERGRLTAGSGPLGHDDGDVVIQPMAADEPRHHGGADVPRVAGGHGLLELGEADVECTAPSFDESVGVGAEHRAHGCGEGAGSPRLAERHTKRIVGWHVDAAGLARPAPR